MRTLGKYELLEEINSGGMGRIYRARDRVLYRDVAVKTIYTGLTDPAVKQRFYREARACAALNHPNIVTVFDLGEQQGNSYIAMELLEGEDLRRFIDRRGSMNLDAKISFMIEVCDGLSSAHAHGIVHRDLKPGNIFVTRAGRPKILDFGVARISASHLTQPGTTVGTPKYMAPEQYLGRECNAVSDLFSAAMVFFEFLAYTHPFEGPDPARWISAEVPARIIKEEPLTLRSLDPALPERLEKIISKALSKDPQQRFQSSGQLAGELKKVSVELVRECSRLLTEVLESRNRILEYKAKLGDCLETPRIQTMLKAKKVDLAAVEKIKPDTSTTALSSLTYPELLHQHGELRRIESFLLEILEESNITGVGQVMRGLSSFIAIGRKTKTDRTSGSN